MVIINAREAVTEFGGQLVGQLVLTAKWGDWPGGVARVLELNPDPEAPDIVMTVKAERRTQFDSRTNIGEEMGIFETEEIGVNLSGEPDLVAQL